MFAGYLEIPDDAKNKWNSEYIYGPEGCKLKTFSSIEGQFCSRVTMSDTYETLNFHTMPPSFTCVLKVKSRSFVKEAVAKLNNLGALEDILKNVPTTGLNHVLYRCDSEEKDISQGKRGTYALEKAG